MAYHDLNPVDDHHFTHGKNIQPPARYAGECLDQVGGYRAAVDNATIKIGLETHRVVGLGRRSWEERKDR